jgi:hypothetical protein
MTPMIQLTMTLQTTLANFFGPTLVSNLALLLNIPSSRIKIVSIREGSVIVETQILPLFNATNNASSTQKNFDELQTIATSIVTLAQTGMVDHDHAEVLYAAPSHLL